MTESTGASKVPMKALRFLLKNLKNAIVWGTQRAPVPVYDVSDEDLDEIEAARRKKKSLRR